MSKNIEQIVVLTFKKFPTVNTLYATADGNVFIDENRAQLHAGIKGKYTTHHREVEKEISEAKKKTANELIAEIKTVENLEALQTYLKDEDRKSVLKAIEDRTAELIENIDVDTTPNKTEE